MATIDRSIQDGGNPNPAGSFHTAGQVGNRFAQELINMLQTNDISKHNFPRIKTQTVRNVKLGFQIQ